MSVVFPITEDPRYRRYTASAGQKVFPVPFPFQDGRDIAVMNVDDETYIEINSAGYVISGAGSPSGGTLTFSTGYAAGAVILVLGRAVLDRLSSIVADGRYKSGLVDAELDRARLIHQEHARDLARALKVQFGDTPQEVPSPDGVSLLGWGPDNKLKNRQTDGASLAAAQAAAEAALAAANAGFVFDTEVDFAAANVPAPLMFARTSGYHAPGDGGGYTKVRIAAPPVPKLWHTQSADGSWWQPAGEDALTFEMLGARGGIYDDYVPIAAMLEFAAGRRIRPMKGRTYRTSQPIVCQYDVCLDCAGAFPSEIFTNGQTFKPLTIQGTFVKSTVLTASKQINVNQWLLDTTGVEPGMLMEVKSSASWYHDPRPLETDARKSELHRVAYIAGTAALYTEDGANDGYEIPAETVTVSFFRPVKVHLENIAVRGVLDAPAETTLRISGGIHIKYGDEPRLINVDAIDCAGTGIFLEECYRPRIIGGKSIGSNNYFSGYGIQFWGCSFGLVQNRKFYNCRRGVDVSGGNIVSIHTTIEGCEAMGGGVNSRGERYGWNPDSSVGAYQAGFGSHGPADHTTYRGNRTANLHSHFECRGRNQIIENNYMIGRSRTGLVSAGYGENLTIRGNKAYAGWSGMKNGAVYDGGGNLATRRADYLVQFAASYDGKLTGRVVIEENELELQDIFVSFATDGIVSSVCNNVIARNNRLSMFPQSSATECVLFNNAFATLALPSGWLLDGNKVTRESGSARIRTFGNIDLRSLSSRQIFGEVFSVNMLDDTVVVIPVPEATIYARVSIDATSASGGGLVGVRQGTATLVTNNGAPANMVGFNGVLTGVNGTDANINVSLQDGFLYVSNRLGSTQRILISINYAY